MGDSVASSSGSALLDLEEPSLPPSQQQQQQQHQQEEQQEHQEELQEAAAQPMLAAAERQEQGQQQQGQQGAQQAYVVVYAPRRAAVELWEPASGRRVAAARYPSPHGLLLQMPAWRAGRAAGLPAPAVPAAAGGGLGPGGGAWAGPRYEPNSVWMLCLKSLRLVDLGPLLLGKNTA